MYSKQNPFTVTCEDPLYSVMTGTHKFQSLGRESPDIQVINALQKKVMFFVHDSGETNDNTMPSFRLRGQESKSMVDFMSSRALPLYIDVGKHTHVTVQAEAFDETDSYANLEEQQKECHSSESNSYRFVNHFSCFSWDMNF